MVRSLNPKKGDDQFGNSVYRASASVLGGTSSSVAAALQLGEGDGEDREDGEEDEEDEK